MKLLWIKTDFLHPTNRGGQIRSLETLRRLHERHEVHYVAYHDPGQPEGLERSREYATKAYPVPHIIPPRRSVRFAGQLTANLMSSLPLAVSRYQTAAMTEVISNLRRTEQFDSVVCDFPFPAPNIRQIEDCVLFQHNVETVIWERHVATSPDPIRRSYFGLQARRMFQFERDLCRKVAHTIAVSEIDANRIRKMFGVDNLTVVPTGVDTDYFSRPEVVNHITDLVFVGSMDWMPNIDGIRYFVEEVFPLILRKRPECSLAIVGRMPPPAISALSQGNPRIHVTGTVSDVRPYLWGSSVSIVPLRIGGGTRLKIYEAMAAKTAVVSTTIGAEGLDVTSPVNIRLADSPEAFAQQCLHLLESVGEREAVAQNAWDLVRSRFSWQHATAVFENILSAHGRLMQTRASFVEPI